MFFWLYVLFLALHGGAHMVYAAFARGWMTPEKGPNWTGYSWLFTRFFGESGTREIGTWIFYLAIGLFVIAALSLALRADWALNAISVAAIYSTLAILVMWDGKFSQIVDKGLIGILINIALLAGLGIFNWPKF